MIVKVVFSVLVFVFPRIVIYSSLFNISEMFEKSKPPQLFSKQTKQSAIWNYSLFAV